MSTDPRASILDNLAEPEQRLVAAARAGKVLELSPEEAIRAEVVRALLCGEREMWKVHPEGVIVRGGRLVGRLILANCTLSQPLQFERTTIPNGIDLDESRTRLLGFYRCKIGSGGNAISARRAGIEGNLILDGTTITGTCNITYAMLNGKFSAVEATFAEESGDAIFAVNSRMIDINLDGATVIGTCDIAYATLSGQFRAVDATFVNKSGAAIHAYGSHMIDLRLTRATVIGACNITGAVIRGMFSANGATFDNKNGTAIHAGLSNIGSWITNGDKKDPVKKEFNAIGTIDLGSATVVQAIEIKDAKIVGGLMGSIRATNLKLDGYFLLGQNTQTQGAIYLAGACIGSRLDFSLSRILSQFAAVPNSNSGRIADDRRPFIALDLSETKIGHLVMPYRELPNSDRPRGIVDLSRARVGTFTDFASAWPEPISLRHRTCQQRLHDADGRDADHLVLNGFEYEHLDNPDGYVGNVPVHVVRLRWLRAQSRDDLFARLQPQPWRHLAKVLAAQGYEEEARRIAIERRVAQRYASNTGRFARSVSWLLHLLADYGFNPWKAVGWSGGVILVCAVIYWWVAAAYCTSPVPLCADGTVFVRTVPADFVPAISDQAAADKRLAETYPIFDPISYSFDVFLPLFDIGTERFWRVNTATWSGVALYYFTVLEQLFGALLVSLIVTGFTGLLTRDET